MADWLDQPLWVLGNYPSLVTLRHEKITQENGPYIANGCMRSLRATYNHGLQLHASAKIRAARRL